MPASPAPAGPSARSAPSALARQAARHRFYLHLLLVCLAVMVCLALPSPLARLAVIGYLLLTLLLLVELGGAGRQPLNGGLLNGGPLNGGPPQRRALQPLYRVVGAATIPSQLFWLFAPRATQMSGLPLLLLFTVFIAWSLLRLVQGLGKEQRISSRVVLGALAGYLLMGISGGLVFSVLETLMPGSFVDARSGALLVLPDVLGSWSLDFIRINYFAFVSLTTVGFGDIVPALPPAQMASLALSVAGPFYIAVVMGLLISRQTNQESRRRHPEP